MALTPEEQKELAELEKWEASTKTATTAPIPKPTGPSRLTLEEQKELAELEKWEASKRPTKLPTEGSFDEHIDTISKKYGVNPSLLRNYAKDVGSLEAAESTYTTGVGKAIGKLSSGIAGVKESIGMGLVGKAERKIRGLVQGAEYEKALDEVQNLVDSRKSTAQKAVEIGAGLVLPGAGIAKGATVAQKVASGIKTGAAFGAASGLGASRAGEEISGTATGAAIGGVIGGAVPYAGSKMPDLIPSKTEIAKSLIKPKRAEEVQELLLGDESKLAQVAEGVVDYAKRQVQQGEKVKPIFKASTRKELVDNISSELDKLGKKIQNQIQVDEAQMAKEMVETGQNKLYSKILNEVDSLKAQVQNDIKRAAISKQEGAKLMKTLDERVLGNLQDLQNDPATLLSKTLEVRRGLQEAVKKGYEPGKVLPANESLMKDAAESLNKAIYESLPEGTLKSLNKDYSNLINYREGLLRGENKKAMDQLLGIAQTGASDFVLSLLGMPTGVLTASRLAKEYLETDAGKLMRLQFGESTYQKIIKESLAKVYQQVPPKVAERIKLPSDIAERLTREAIKGAAD